METKNELIDAIKDWVGIDNEIIKLQKDLKERRNKKKELSKSLLNVMKTNEIDCFDITGGALVYKKSIVKKGLTGKSLMTILQNYYKSTPDKAEEMTKYILDNRQEEVKETIKRKIDK